MKTKTYTLPDGIRLPLEISLPAAELCEAGSWKNCQGAEGLRNIGAFDPQVLKDADNPHVYFKYRGKGDNVWCIRCNAPLSLITVAGSLDDEDADSFPAGTKIVLPKPYECLLQSRRTTPRKPRRDKGMSKAKADEVFNRQAGPYKGRRTDQLKGVAKKLLNS